MPAHPHLTRRVLAAGSLALLGGIVLAIASFWLGGSEVDGPPHTLPEVPATAMDIAARVASNSPQLAVDPAEPRFVVLANRLDGPAFSCSLQVSGDGGRSWITDNPVVKLPAGAERCYAPEVAFDRTGILHYLFVGLRGAGNSPMGVFLTDSTDGARSFSTPRRILGAERYMVRMALDPDMGDMGRLHLVWLQPSSGSLSGGLPPSPNPIMASHSDDGGQTFSPPVQVSDPARRLVVAPALAVGPDHAVHVLYYDLGRDVRDYEGLEGPTWDDDWSLVMSTSSDAGGRFERSSVVDAGVTPPERVMLIYTMPPPSLAVDGHGRIFAAWHDARNGDWDVFLRRSTDDGRTWGQLRRLNDDALHDGRNQYLPRLSIAPGGRIDAIFYDRRNNAENRGNDVYYAFSTDGGMHFSANVRLTALDSDSRVGPRYGVVSARGLVEFGSRLALVSGSNFALAAWTDTRNDARGVTAQDIFATRIDLPTASRPAVWAWASGLLLALFGLALLAPRLRASLRRSAPGERRGR